MKILFICFFLLPAFIAFSQPSERLQSLVNAERAFAKTAKDKSTKEAFITYLSDSGLIFRPGPILGKKFWQEADETTDLLTWDPVFAAVCDAGDLGYSTGPWEYRSKRTDINPAAAGYFVSIWKKEKGEWKVALDIGVSYPPTSEKEIARFDDGATANVNSQHAASSKKELMDKEVAFILDHAKAGWETYSKYMSEKARFYRPGSFPFITEESRKKLFTETGKKISYEPTDAGVSSSNDLGYVYGKAIIETTGNGSAKTLKGNYLRIWKKEKDDWKIMLDLVNSNQ